MSRIVELGAIGFETAATLLNEEFKRQDGKHEILLERKACEYIVTKTNRVLSVAKSVWRLSAKGESFSLR